MLRHDEPEVRDAAAMALGESRRAEALDPLRDHFSREADSQSRKTGLLAIALLRAEPAVDFLLTVVKTFPSEDAAGAVDALALYRHDATVRARLEETVKQRPDDRLRRAFAKSFGG
jgi:HEAT repeat protein